MTYYMTSISDKSESKEEIYYYSISVLKLYCYYQLNVCVSF